MNKEQKKNINGIGYRIFKQYVHLYHDTIYYRKTYTVNSENIPQDCPLMIVSNHQNSICDPLALLFTLKSRKKRKTRIISRADVFNRPVANKFLRWLGILPAYRIAVDGMEYLENNIDTFETAEEELLNNGTIIIYPEGKHQNKRWLGEFSSGYLRIVFEAAKKSNFEKEIFILPSCNHYSNYYDSKEDVLIKYGTPISIAPFYELYKTKPRTAQKQVNALVREQVGELMLNITDLENYKAFDYLRNTYGVKYAKEKGFNPEKLPEKLLSDKQLYTELENLKEKNNETLQNIYDNTRILEEKTKELNINDRNFDKKYYPWKMCFEGAVFVLLAPLFFLGCLPNVMVVFAPSSLTKKVKDPMLHSSIKFGIGVFFTIPVLYSLTFFLIWKVITGSLIFSLICLFFLPALGAFAVNYKQAFAHWQSEWRFYKLLGKGELFDLISLRRNTYQLLDNLLGTRFKILYSSGRSSENKVLRRAN
ncbi:1-acyl-sn-glycerol-3-phosphate acyltransferase [Bacteroidales bacterium OttesenSCG-928-C19]|nr:1-acyl-sn-glycerol-3-phosphate acyltransferase [Bacteroidales bacterium OttesenSCG-928-C19]